MRRPRDGVHGILDGKRPSRPEDDRKLKKLEQKPVELKLALARPHLEEPYRMSPRPVPKPFGGEEILQLIKYWRKERKRQRRSERKVRQREKKGGRVR